jgi:hypothetical protein
MIRSVRPPTPGAAPAVVEREAAGERRRIWGDPHLDSSAPQPQEPCHDGIPRLAMVKGN